MEDAAYCSGAPLGERSHFTSVFLHPARGWGSDTGPVETDALAHGPAAIDAEMARLAPVAASGGFIPLVDHGVPDLACSVPSAVDEFLGRVPYR
jgi:hypothetical protein